jgi:hypothetical protein
MNPEPSFAKILTKTDIVKEFLNISNNRITQIPIQGSSPPFTRRDINIKEKPMSDEIKTFYPSTEPKEISPE